METEYTILVSTVTEFTIDVSLANKLRQPVTDLPSDKYLKQALERASIDEAAAAAKRQS